MQIFPPQFTRIIKKETRKILGIFVILFAIFVAIAISFYTTSDLSFNTATNEIIKNPTLKFGSYVSDVLIQLFGYMSWLFIFSIFIIGWKIIKIENKVISLPKFLLLIFSLFLLGTSLQSLFTNQIIDNDIIVLKPIFGAVSLVFAQKIHSILIHLKSIKWFIPIMFSFFIFGLILWKYSLEITFKGMYFYLKRIYLETHKILQKLKILNKKPVSEFQSSEDFFSEEDRFNTEDNLFENIVETEIEKPIENSNEEKSKNIRRQNQKNSGYKKPSTDLLSNVKEENENSLTKDDLMILSKDLLNVLSEFGINGEIIDVQPGPVVTMYEFRPAPGIKTSRVISLSYDIARSMSALSARIATIPGKNAIGIELPNEKRNTVFLRPLLQTNYYKNTSANLPLILGKDISGKAVIADLAKMPHLLVAGTTGSGKSVSINTMILSLIYKFTPEECKFIMVDPKMLELSIYDDIPHLLTPVVTDPKKAIFALKWAVREMESRYKAMSRLGVRNIDGFNKKVQLGKQHGDIFTRRVQTGFDPETGKPVFEDQTLDYQEYPYIVVVVDEMADLMLVAGKEIESAVQRLAQMARAAGIHLIMATQRPSVDVITGTIKANFPTRISFQVSSKIDSRTILGEQGAEQLLGHGDMLYMSGGGRIQRVHGPFVSDSEIEKIAKFLKSQSEPNYVDGITDETDEMFEQNSEPSGKNDLFKEAVDFIRREGRVSISFIQRRFQIGYNKAAGLVEQMEKEGIVTTPDRSGKRELI